MDFDILVLAVPKQPGSKKYLLAKIEASTDMGDELLSAFDGIFPKADDNLLKVAEYFRKQSTK